MQRIGVCAVRWVEQIAQTATSKQQCTCVAARAWRQQQSPLVRSLVTTSDVWKKERRRRKQKAKDTIAKAPPANSVPFHGEEEVDKAIFRLRRKLRRFVLHPRTAAKLEAMWTLYADIKRSTAWRISDEELAQFLRAIQRAGMGMAWLQRAEELAGESPVLGGDATMALLRVYAKYGDTLKFERAAADARLVLGAAWAQAQAGYAETWAIAYARADLPAQAQAIISRTQPKDAVRDAVRDVSIDTSRDTLRDAVGDTPRDIAREELLLAWARARKADQAWAVLAQLRAPAPTRVWNALLHMHAVDARYRLELVEQVHGRMIGAGGSADQATFNILMHAALVRGRQARWRHWLERMEAAGLAADAHTFTALASALIDAGRWAEAARAIGHMRACGVAPTPATAVSAMQMLRRRSRAAAVLARFRQAAARGARIEPHEFTQAAAAALEDPRACAAELALLVRCLERGHVPASAAVDALAARLPGLSAAAVAGRPLLHALRKDPALAGRALLAGLADLDQRGSDLGSDLGSYPGSDLGSDLGSELVVGEHRKSYAETLHAVVRALLRSGSLRQAEQLVHAASRAQIGDVRVREPDAVAALVVGLVAAGQLGDAAPHAARLERLAEARPSVRAFGALLRFASASRDARALEATWRRMGAHGVGADACSHRARVACYAALGDILRTRRAYADMLDDGHAPHAAAVAALVRCCVRAASVGLALTAVRHAERHGCAVAPASYNCIMSRCAPLPALHRRIDALFDAMLRTPDARLCHAPGDVADDVTRLKDRLDDLPPACGPRTLAGWLDESDSRAVARRLVGWLTSRAAYPAAASLGEPGVRKLGAPSEAPPSMTAEPELAAPLAAAPPPPPNATSFIIAMRFYGQNRRWADVLRAWESLAAFNRRISLLQHPYAQRHRVTPFSRMIGWAALALVETGRMQEARSLWDSAARDGTLSDNARSLGMDHMLRQLPQRK